MAFVGIHQPNFLPWFGYFSKIAKSDIFIFLDDVKCSKNSFFNRNRFSSNGSWFWLGIPLKKESYHQNICDVTCNNLFIEKHLKYFKMNHLLKSRNTKLISNLIDLYEEYKEHEVVNISEFNIDGISLILKHMNINTTIIKSSTISRDKNLRKQDLIIELVKSVGGDCYISGAGARSYQNISDFKKNGIRVSYSDFDIKQYHQIDKEYMSVVDCFLRATPETLVKGLV